MFITNLITITLGIVLGTAITMVAYWILFTNKRTMKWMLRKGIEWVKSYEEAFEQVYAQIETNEEEES